MKIPALLAYKFLVSMYLGSYQVSSSELFIQHSTLNACRPLKNGVDSFNIQANNNVFIQYGLDPNAGWKAFVDEGLLANKAGDFLTINDQPLNSS